MSDDADASGNKSRSRGNVDAENLAKIIAPFFKSVKGIPYGEGKKASIDERLITAQAELLRELAKVSENLSFVYATILGAMRIIALDRNQIWNVSEAKVEEWIARMSDRLRNMLRHVQQGRCRDKPQAWVAALKMPEYKRKTTNEESTALRKAETAMPEAEDTSKLHYDVSTGVATLRTKKGGNRKHLT